MSHFLVDSQVLHRNGKLQEAEVAYKRAYTGPLQQRGVDLNGYTIFYGQRMGSISRNHGMGLGHWDPQIPKSSRLLLSLPGWLELHSPGIVKMPWTQVLYICYCASNVFKSWIASAWYRDRKIDRWIVDWCLLESGKFHFPSGLARLSQASNQSILHRMQCSTMLNLGFKTRLGLKHSKTLAVACRQSGLIKWLAWATGLPQQPETTCAYPVAVLIRLLISTMFFFIFHHFPSFFIIFHHFPSFSIVFHHFPSFSSFSIIFHHFPSFSIIFHQTIRMIPLQQWMSWNHRSPLAPKPQRFLSPKALEGLAAVLKEAGGAI